jgi:hypothetical protein
VCSDLASFLVCVADIAAVAAEDFARVKEDVECYEATKNMKRDIFSKAE